MKVAYWRIKLRDGLGGHDMWPACKENRIAAITYEGIEKTDLRPYSRTNHPPGWEQVGSKGSLNHFAFGIKGGDTIYVGDSVSHKLIGNGYALASIGELAYRFDAYSPISAPSGKQWCHLIDVDWETFEGISYKDRDPIITVLELTAKEIEEYDKESQLQEHRTHGHLLDEEAQDVFLHESNYSRYTPAASRLIHRRHVVLSNQFKLWLAQKHIILTQERNQIDATFEVGKKRFLVEFKIAYQGDTKRAIREALGQILEYNHYPPRVSHDTWLIILDTAPNEEDTVFLKVLSESYRLPLVIGWKTNSSFMFEPSLEI